VRFAREQHRRNELRDLYGVSDEMFDYRLRVTGVLLQSRRR